MAFSAVSSPPWMIEEHEGAVHHPRREGTGAPGYFYYDDPGPTIG